MIEVDWSILKDFIITRSVKLQYVEEEDNYLLTGVDQVYALRHLMDKFPSDTTDLLDFENNFKATANAKIGRQTFSNSDLNVNASLVSNPANSIGCPVISSKLKIERDDLDIIITSQTVYMSIYLYNGSGKFFGVALDFNSNKVQFRLKIDSEIIFDLSFRNIEDMSRFGGGANKGDSRDMCKFFRIGASDRIEFCPPCPIAFATSIELDAINTTSSNKILTEKFVFLTKET